jgi:glycosyltransferase involved in cell wall biosynthesis
MRAKISVCLAIHNGERFLQQQIESIIPQLNGNDEIICSDDHSTDQSIPILESFHDARIKITKPSSSGSHVRNFEHALNRCTGDFIFLSDHDDIWNDHKVDLMSGHLIDHHLVLSDCSMIDENNLELAPSLFKIQKTKSGILKNWIKNTYTGCCMAFRKEILTKALPFPEGIWAHDQWIGLIAEKYYSVYLLPETLVKYRRHKNNFSSTGDKSKLTWLDQLCSRVTLVKSLSFR